METKEYFVLQKFENEEWITHNEFETEPEAKDNYYYARLYGKKDDRYRVIFRKIIILETDISVQLLDNL